MAEELGMELFSMRGTTRPDFLSVEAALDQAEKILETPNYSGTHTGDPKGPVVIADGEWCTAVAPLATVACCEGETDLQCGTTPEAG